MLSDVGGCGVNECFFIKENWICAITRYHANNIFNYINILLARNLPFDAEVRQWSHLLIPFHCLWARSNSRTSGQFEYDVTLFFFFCFCLICSFTYTGRLLLQSLFTFSSYANKTGWLQNEHWKKPFLRKHFVML